MLRLVHAGRLKPIEEALRDLAAAEKPRTAQAPPLTAPPPVIESVPLPE